MKKRGSRVSKAVAAIFVAALLPCAMAHAQVDGTIIKKGGKKVAGGIRWKARTKQYEVSVRGGQSMIITPKQVEKMVIEEPPNLAQAVKAVQKGQFTGRPVTELQKIMGEYEMLQHDVTAVTWLAVAYLNTGKEEEAFAAFNKVMADRDESAMSAHSVRVYWDVLLKNEKFAELEKEVRKGIEQGSRAVAAVAQIKRGDMDRLKKNYKEALVGGYLRTIVLYKEIRDVQPEALYRAAECFEELGQSPYAEKMRKKLLAEYPKHRYSTMVRAGG